MLLSVSCAVRLPLKVSHAWGVPSSMAGCCRPIMCVCAARVRGALAALNFSPTAAWHAVRCHRQCSGAELSFSLAVRKVTLFNLIRLEQRRMRCDLPPPRPTPPCRASRLPFPFLVLRLSAPLRSSVLRFRSLQARLAGPLEAWRGLGSVNCIWIGTR